MPVKVTGERLNIIQHPKIIIWGHNDRMFEGVSFIFICNLTL